jgi:hypothetical protein
MPTGNTVVAEELSAIRVTGRMTDVLVIQQAVGMLPTQR